MTMPSEPVPPGAGNDLPDDNDVIVWQLEERDGVDVYRVTKGGVEIGQYTGRSIGSSVLHVAVGHLEPGRSVWLKDELSVRRLTPRS